MNRSLSRAIGFAAVSALAFYFTLSTIPHAWNPESRGGHHSGAYEALRFWTDSRAYPEADIAQDKYAQAFEHAQTLSKEASPAVGSASTWRSIGPTHFSGRMIGLALNPLNPNTIYAGAASGGLWRTRTGGRGGDWTRISTGFPVLGVNDIAISPQDTNTLYIGTGEVYSREYSVGGQVIRTTRGSYGMGLLKTTDGGATWEKSLDWSYNQRRGVQAIRINPSNRNTLFAATTEGVYRSRDAGDSWLQVLSVPMARDLVIHPNDTTRLIAACGNFASPGNGIYRSTNGGDTWSKNQKIPSFSGYPRLEMWAKDPNVVYASLADSFYSGSLWRSTDFGDVWFLVNSSSVYGVQGWYSQFVAVHPTDSSQIIRGGQQIWRSDNGGRSQEVLYGMWADYHNYAHHPTDPDQLFIVDDGGVWLTNDYGASDSWIYLGDGLLTTQFYNGFSVSSTDSLLSLGQVQDHFGWMYGGSPPSWVDGGIDEVGWTAINPKNDLVMYAVARNGSEVYRSLDGGASYFSLPIPPVYGAAWNSPIVISYSNPDVLYFGKVGISKTTNGGSSWFVTNGGNSLDGNPALSMAISFSSPDTVYVGTAPLATRAHLWRTINGGVSWLDVTGPLPDRYPMDIAVDPADARVVYVAMGGFGTGHLFKSSDAGETWSDITGILPDVPATAVVADPFASQHVYAGTDVGVFLSTDAGTTWSVFNEGLPEAAIIADLAIARGPKIIRAATHSNGVFERQLLSAELTSVGPHPEAIPALISLAQNYPNPFNPDTKIEYRISKIESVRLVVHDLLGREVAVLVNGEQQAGSHTVRFDGAGLSTGIYLYRLEAGGTSLTRKMLLAR